MKKKIKHWLFNFICFLVKDDFRLRKLLLGKVEKHLLNFTRHGYLKEIGWTRSVEEEKIINATGDPIPWLTYPFISFLEPRLQKTMHIFEYGAGSSTQYFSARVQSVTAVEHDEKWYNIVQKSLAKNVQLFFEELEYDGAYSKMILNQNQTYDIIIVDGRDRVNCTFHAVKALREKGVLIFDNSDRSQYQPALDFLEEQGFKRLDFWGLQAGFTNTTCSSLFYKTENCLNV